MRSKAALMLFLFVCSLCCLFPPGSHAAEQREDWMARAVSVQGDVQVRRGDYREWVRVELDDTFFQGDMIRVGQQGRAGLLLHNNTFVRLDQGTSVAFLGVEKKETSLFKILSGAAMFFSRFPRALKVFTPYVNANVEGTEFLVQVDREQTIVTVFEGKVAAANDLGSLSITRGQSLSAQATQPPMLRTVLQPRDAVQWALYYPPVIHYQPDDFSPDPPDSLQAMLRRSVEFYRRGDLASAFSSLEKAPADAADPRLHIIRAALYLTVGDTGSANVEIQAALALDPSNGQAAALQSVIALTRNRKNEALELAQRAISLDPASPVPRIALSYALQAHFDLKGAMENLDEAVRLEPTNALAWARLAELRLCVADLNGALDAAQRAADLNPELSRTQTVLGFAYLARIDIKESKNAFRKAIRMDQADPLPRLGLGLAKIREGDLKEGRIEIEIAVGLDPANSLLRSYLGKAYFEEKREKQAGQQLTIAKELDPRDPTPWFYDAILKQTVNRPVEALKDLQQSMALNDNRAVYRSRLQLDEDLAARGASLARVYDDLGFGQLAFAEASRSLSVDPSSHSAHRFLADSYASLPRHEIARVSEILQSQLLQPVNIYPVQPRLAQSRSFILQGAGPSDLSFNEYTTLFNRDRLALQTSGIAGGNSTFGDEVIQSGVWGRMSYSLGQYHYETDGFRRNNDLVQDLYNVFAQASLSPATSVQGEFRYSESEKGDLSLRFDPDDYLPTIRQNERMESGRFGFRHSFSPGSDLLASFIYRNLSDDSTNIFPPPLSKIFPNRFLSTDIEGYMAEVQHLFRSSNFHLVSGAGYLGGNQKSTTNLPGFPPESDIAVRNANMYIYSLIHYPSNITWVIGGSGDFFDEIDRKDEFNPKFGVTWSPISGTTLRGAAFRVLKRPLIQDQTLEPTQVAGFNQYFDDADGTESWRYGAGIDQKITSSLFGGVELSRRDLEVPYVSSGPVLLTLEEDWREQLARAYFYWTPQDWLALSAEYQFERFDREGGFAGTEDFVEIKTHRIPLGINLFHRSGLLAGFRATYVDQKGEYGNPLSGFRPGSDQFFVLDAVLGYRLPKRFGLITLEARNLLDEGFNFQDTDPSNPVIYPERLILLRLTLQF